jgi:hypothetical protein
VATGYAGNCCMGGGSTVKLDKVLLRITLGSVVEKDLSCILSIICHYL